MTPTIDDIGALAYNPNVGWAIVEHVFSTEHDNWIVVVDADEYPHLFPLSGWTLSNGR